MFVDRVINTPVDSNCFVLSQENSNKCIVIDPGTEDCRELIDLLHSKGLMVQYIFLTHEHIDHIIGLKVLYDSYDCKLICSDLCAGYLNNTRYNLSRMAEQFTPRDSFPVADIVFENTIQVVWNNNKVTFCKMQGHSEGSAIAFVDNQLFVGDTIIKAYRTTTTLPGGSKKDLINSFEMILKEYASPDILVHFGHFESCTMGELKSEIEAQICFFKEKLEKKRK